MMKKSTINGEDTGVLSSKKCVDKGEKLCY